METGIIISVVLSIVGTIIGFFIGKLLADKASQSKIEIAKVEAEKIIIDAERTGEAQKKEQFQKAKAEADRLKKETESMLNKKRNKINNVERNIKEKDQKVNQQRQQLKRKETELGKLKTTLDEQLGVINKKKQDLSTQQQRLNKKQESLDKKSQQIEQKLQKELEKVANLTSEEAKQQLVNSMMEKAESEAMSYIKTMVDEAKLKANKEAKKIIIQTIQRTAAEHTIENTVSVFNLESDDVKGQIIGREGRNIRALEAATGVEIIVDDTPEAIVISGYDPVRREIARLALHRLVTDGRIHPARIEEVVAKTKKQLSQQIVEIGERTVIDLNIHGMHPELIRTVGRMRFRSSYGQNLLQHSIETAKLCAMMAAELGLSPTNVKLAKRAGLLHDIGKVPEEETELSHALLGMKISERFKEHPAVCNAVGAHHDEIEMGYLISPIVQACDAISGARPGARREILESYLKRIAELENLAMSYDGVEKAYAIQAGRELRIMVESDRVPDAKAEELSFKISQKIQTEMQYPGQIKVTVIREKRAISYAR